MEQLSLSGNVEFLGHRDDIAQIMNSIDLLLVPSLDEPFGYINIEAGAAGVPVIASAVGGIPEIIVEGETGLLVAPEDSNALSEAICRVFEDGELLQRLGRGAEKHVERCFSQEQGLLKWEGLFESLIGE